MFLRSVLEKSTHTRCAAAMERNRIPAGTEELHAFRSPAKVYSNEGLCRILFLRSDDARRIGDADRNGGDQRYQEALLPSLQGV
jgi:hypothetical protein